MEEMVKPYLSPGSVTGQSYIKMLRTQFLPALEAFHAEKEVCRLMHAEAPTHFYRRQVRELLSSTFLSKCMDGTGITLYGLATPVPEHYYLWLTRTQFKILVR